MGFLGIELDDKNLSRWIHKKTGNVDIYKPGMDKEWLEEHEWLVDKNELSCRLNLKTDRDVFVSGIPSNIFDILDLFDSVFFLKISMEKAIQRIINRSTIGAFGKSKDEIRSITEWKDIFIEKILKYGAIPINAECALHVVVNEILLKR